ncbi:MAG: cobalamin biosynthesis protein [Romboutsia sp.]
MKIYGVCPASCGEFVQGILGSEEYLCSYAIDMYSTAVLEEKINDINRGPYKSRKAIEAVFKRFGIPIKCSKNISLSIKSEIPVGKGMASSTADIGATIKATLSLLNKNLTSREISKLASNIEPTDSIFIEENSIFNPLNGETVKTLGNIYNGRVIVLEPNRTLSTARIRKIYNYEEKKINNKSIIQEAFFLLEEGIKNNDLNLVGRASTMSSLANENIHRKDGLNKIIDVSRKYGAYGVNIAHSGTVVGILIDKDMNDRKIIELLRQEGLDNIYKKIYTSNIIDGGVREEIKWNTSKIL